MPEPTVVIVSGLPATGKTTVAHKIGEGLKLPVFTKDYFKEIIAESIGAKDPSVKGLGRASHSILFYIAKRLLENDLSLVIEGNFKDTEHTREFISYLKEKKKRVIEIHCVTELGLRLDRYASRERHPVHPTLDDPEYAKSFKETEDFSLGVGTFLTVDTTDFAAIPYESMFNTVRGN